MGAGGGGLNPPVPLTLTTAKSQWLMLGLVPIVEIEKYVHETQQ